MQLYDIITGPDGQNLSRLAKNLGLSDRETADVVRAVLPELSYNMERRTLSRDGLAAIVQNIGNPERGNYLDPDTDLTSGTAVDQGNDLLGEIMYTKYRSRALADRAAGETGVPADKIRRMLPRIANVSVAALGSQTRPALEDIFKKLPTFPKNAPAGNRTRAGGSPLPLPADDWGGQGRDHNRYDDLSDILTRRQGPVGSNPLWSVVREIIGSAMGFESKTVMGYIIRFIVYRFGWTIVRWFFGRMFR